jgi:hypothetical protein
MQKSRRRDDAVTVSQLSSRNRSPAGESVITRGSPRMLLPLGERFLRVDVNIADVSKLSAFA